MKLLIIIPILVFECTVLVGQNSFIASLERIPIPLSNEYYYGFLDFNEEYIVMGDIQLGKLIVYSFATKKTNEIPLNFGRGPNEISAFIDLEIDQNNQVYILDHRAYKLLQISLEDKSSKDIPLNIKTLPTGFDIYDNKMYVRLANNFTYGSYYMQAQLLADTLIFKPLSYNYSGQEPPNILKGYYFRGWNDFNNDYIVHAHKNHSLISLYPLNADSNSITTIQYDSDNVFNKDDYETSKSGEFITVLPPERINAIVNAVFAHSSNPNLIYLNIYGRTKFRNYYDNEILEFNLKKRKFTRIYDLGFKPYTINRHKDILIIHSIDESTGNHTIYKARLHE